MWMWEQRLEVRCVLKIKMLPVVVFVVVVGGSGGGVRSRSPCLDRMYRVRRD